MSGLGLDYSKVCPAQNADVNCEVVTETLSTATIVTDLLILQISEAHRATLTDQVTLWGDS